MNNSHFVATALAAASLCAALPALAQGNGLERNTPDIPSQQQARPAERPAPQVQPPARAADRREQPQGQRDANRRDPPRADQGREAQRRDNDRRQADRRNWDQRAPERRNYGYVVPRPNFYYPPPPVYYSAPPVYYGAIPQPYYPSYAPQVMFQPGDYLPPEYRQQQFVVEDWQWRGLAAPPFGYHWLVLGSDYFVLVADQSGQIVSMVATR